ncbi:hypothetical protein F8M41_013914 [Gigaspora margarita]|uniref:Uncharacterized protein n=1 Tax=Gigaspora margarita TaxID=4874 RepID=A0A8H3ZYW4_GIGMA|nr:hypothetical protein F8M41_013914 [Gigaspora margarita]
MIRSNSEVPQDSNVNIFTQFGSAILASYYIIITEDSTPISPWISKENIIIMIITEIELFYLLPYQRRKNNWFPKIIFHHFKFHEIVKKIRNNQWDNINIIPFLSETLLEITNIAKIKKNDQIIIEDTDKKAIQELKKNFNEEIQNLKTMMKK